MKRLVVLSILSSMTFAACPAWAADLWLSGGGERVVEDHALPPFNRVAIEGFAEVVLVQGKTESASIEVAADDPRSVRFDVTDGKLTVANPDTPHWWRDLVGGKGDAVRITLTYRTLNAIDVGGAAKLRADRLAADRLALSASGAAAVRISALDAKELTVSGSGAIKIDIAGRVVDQRIRMSGAGDYRAAKLDSETAKVAVSGAGRVAISAAKTLDIEVSGAGVVEYLGNPKVMQSVSGVGRVKRRDAD